MIIFSLIILLVYSIVFILFRFSWKNLKKNFSSFDISTSIIIAVRNEEENILNLLKDISAQNYPKRNIETILVDDGSSDKTVQILKENKSRFDFKLYQLSDSNKGKKQAIKEGVKHAKGKILLFIDADCRLNKNWAIEMLSIFNDKSVSMVSGPVMFIENNILDKIQNLEFLSLIGLLLTNICCSVAFTKPPIIFIRVVFPQPEGPTIHTNSFGLMKVSISLSAVVFL